MQFTTRMNGRSYKCCRLLKPYPPGLEDPAAGPGAGEEVEEGDDGEEGLTGVLRLPMNI